jgi:hypothetical protein
LFSFLLSGLKIKKAKAEAIVYDPVAIVNYRYKPSTDEKPFEIPELGEFFKKLVVKNGSLNIRFTYPIDSEPFNDFTCEESFSKINVTLSNKDKTTIKLQTYTFSKGSIEAKATITQGYIASISAEIKNYKPKYVDLAPLEGLSTELSGKFAFTQKSKDAKPDIDFEAKLFNTLATYTKHQLNIPLTSTYGNLKSISFDISDIMLNNNRLSVVGKATDYLTNPDFSGTISVMAADLNEFEPDLHGIASGTASVTGTIGNLYAKGSFYLPEGMYQSEVINNVNAEAIFSDNKVSFTADDFQWREQNASTKGSYDLVSNSLEIDLKTAPANGIQAYAITSDLSSIMEFGQGDVNIDVKVNDLGFQSKDVVIKGLHGSVNLTNNAQTSFRTMADLSLSNNNGLSLNSKGDLDSILINADIDFKRLPLAEYLPILKSQDLSPIVSGNTSLKLFNNDVSGFSLLDIELDYFHSLSMHINSDYNVNLDELEGKLSFTSSTDIGKEIPLDLDFKLSLENNLLRVDSLIIDQNIHADAWANLNDFTEHGIKVTSNKFNTSRILDIFYKGEQNFPVNANLDLDLNYNYNNDQTVNGSFVASNVIIPELHTLNIPLVFTGTTQEINLAGSIETMGKGKIDITSKLIKSKDYKDLRLIGNGIISNLKASDILTDKKIKGSLEGSTDWIFSTQKGVLDYNLACKVKGHDIKVHDIIVDSLDFDMSQTPLLLKVNKAYIKAEKLISINGVGALDYDIFTGNFSQGNQSMNVSMEGDILRWVKNNVSMIESAKSRFKAQAELKLTEEGIGVESGSISLSHANLKLKDQVEPIENIDIQGRIVANELFLDRFTCQIGQGKLFVRNKIDSGEDNFYIGPLNLGYFLVRTDDNGIQISFPGYLSENTTASAIIKGQDSREATIKGPFDDMEIKGEILASNASVVYPPNTKNILQLVDIFQMKHKNKVEDLPLPFTLDLLIVVSENVNYVTYPANLSLLKGSFFRLTYDGKIWDAKEADFMTEKGTLDFYGTVFDVEFVKFEINSQRNIVAVNGTFTKKAADGTLITLTVSTDPHGTGEIMDKLSFKLTSDNPQDRTNIQILSRLRYGRNIEELDPSQRQSLLQDEAMQVISTSVSTTYISQFLSPVESKIRKWLKLDSFAISTGFVQNLFVEFTSEKDATNNLPNDPNTLNSDILQFSSSILLNNLSLSMGKYLGKNVYLDYRIQAQETTDLAKKTRLDFYQDTSIRYNLPWQLRLVYTFGIKPAREKNTHELMIQRSFRF